MERRYECEIWKCHNKNPDDSVGAGNGHGGKGIGAVCEYAGGTCEEDISKKRRGDHDRGGCWTTISSSTAFFISVFIFSPLKVICPH